jgi:hypothetical protein
MAKPKNNLTGTEVNEAANELMLTGKSSQGISWAEAFDFAEQQETTKMKTLTGASWLKLEEFGVFTFAFMGMSTAQTEDGETEVVKLVDREGVEYISSLAVLLSTCKNLKVIPTFLKIEYLADKKGTNGKYKDLKIYSL